MILHAVEPLADRIERSYLRHSRPLNDRFVDRRIWTLAALQLLRVHRANPMYPLDPEMYVACQPIRSGSADPMSDLTRPSSVRRYRNRVRRIVRQLRGELQAEVRLVEGRMELGEPIESVLRSRRCRSVSPLGCFIVACRAGRADLMDRLRSLAQEQHQSCPLYLQASIGLLPADDYPTPSEIITLGNSNPPGETSPASLSLFSLN